MNLVEIAGFLGADAEERFTSGGKRVIGLRVGCKARANKEDITIWWRVNIWSDRFDKMVPYLKKGAAVFIVGEMGKPETYVDKEGKTQVSLTLQAEIVKFSPFGKSGKSSEEGSSLRGQNSFGTRDEGGDEMAFAGGGGHQGNQDHNFEGDDLPF